MNAPKVNSEVSRKLLDDIKIWAIQAMFSDDDLLEQLVLKGGNAMALVHQVSARASVDLDFSLKHDFGENTSQIEDAISRTLSETFRENGYEVIDFKMAQTPKRISEDMKDFWGGYGVEFKLVTAANFQAHAGDIEAMRKWAINLGLGPKFLIEISRFEYVEDKQQKDLDGYTIYVYSPEMIVCEKLRAICQQMPEYAPIVKRGPAHASRARARDFVDIHVLVDKLRLDMTSAKAQRILTSMFEVKKVPLSFLGAIPKYRALHQADFSSVQATVDAGFALKDFDFYFDYTLQIVDSLKPVWDV
ncbi:nucleotidyl transferase AbiEii/AbiGii toxin family protein [Variovorax sp. VNK109]|uniref:nucleotidyl transferase AbiEii/AbiGii toxin family protein n=1 Tax=Variovorax sp. VNK109 TaxID=3400919 RepID=UPI003BFF7A83